MPAHLFVRATDPRSGRRHAYLYDVEFSGRLVVTGSTDPACDLARALLARGIKGKVAVYAGLRHRYTVNIEKAAKLHAYDHAQKGPIFEKYRETGDSVPHSQEAEAA